MIHNLRYNFDVQNFDIIQFQKDCDGLYTAVHSVTSLPPAVPTSVSSVPPLLSAFPHHARTSIKGKPESQLGQYARGLVRQCLLGPRCAHSYRPSGERKIVIATSPSRR